MDTKEVAVKVNEKPDEKEDILKKAIQETVKVERSKDVKVLVHMLNIREHANPNSKVVTVVRSGDEIKVNTTPNGEWYQVIEPVKGFVKTEFVG